ncbi:MAG: TRAP transporter small permease subunit [Gammaproteobacteria bacterium]|nr:TRAP transporter small permease subunit [Gammaproteobacteria bacterium]
MTNSTKLRPWERWLKGLFGGFEITELMLASLIFCGLPLVTLEQEHVSVDLFDRFIPQALHRFRDLLVLIACNLCVGVLAWRMWLKARESQAYGDITAVLELPLAPVFFLGCFALALTVVVFMVLLYRRFLSDDESLPAPPPNA